MKRKALLAALAGLIWVAGGAQAAAPPAPFFQGFEIDSSGWFFDVERVESGTNDIVSATGDYHAKVGSDFTRWGGYSPVFPVGGYTTSVDVFLNVADANDTRFDFSSAINNTSGGHLRDFVFNAGFYNDTDVTGSGPRFVISASTNATRSAAFPKNPGKDPFTLTQTGWYSLQHRFSGVTGGVLSVELSLINSSGTTLHTWTLSDPSDIIGGTVGGNRYGWFVSNEFGFLAVDDTFRQSDDSDQDGILDDQDACPFSDRREFVDVNGDEPGVTSIPNSGVNLEGCSIQDLVNHCAEEATNHTQYVNCIADLANTLRNSGVITNRQSNEMKTGSARSKIGR